jgi:RNA polymerase subunit RPABC4/transcription elongation factor Spt4
MSVLIFLLLAAASAGIIIYPMLPGRAPAQPAQHAPALTEGEIERAVRDLRRARSRSAEGSSHDMLACPDCGAAYHQGDLFCVRCGRSLPTVDVKAAPDELLCSSCGNTLHAGDQFCAKCGQPVVTKEAE